MTDRMTKGVLQANGTTMARAAHGREPVANAVVYMAACRSTPTCSS
jgi:hypothetical protein